MLFFILFIIIHIICIFLYSYDAFIVHLKEERRLEEEEVCLISPFHLAIYFFAFVFHFVESIVLMHAVIFHCLHIHSYKGGKKETGGRERGRGWFISQ